MILTATYETQNGTTKTQHINIDLISSWTECEGKKLDAGYQTVMYTQNGHALYTTLTPNELTLACQGGIMTEESVRAYIDQAVQQTQETEDADLKEYTEQEDSSEAE